MQAKNCDEYLTHETVEEAFVKKITALSDKIIRCFYKCYYTVFIRSSVIKYSSYLSETVEDLADQSFTDAILVFQTYVAKNGLRRKAGIKRILEGFYTPTLQNLIRRETKKTGGIPDNKSNETEIESPDENDSLFKEENFNCLQQSLTKISDDDKEILRLRYWEDMNMKDIAKQLNTSPGYATEKLFRLRNRLEKMIEQCKKN